MGGLKEERSDLFSNLLDANEHEEDRAAKLSDSALIGTRLLVWCSSEGLLKARSIIRCGLELRERVCVHDGWV